jgi:hypothetical protein
MEAEGYVLGLMTEAVTGDRSWVTTTPSRCAEERAGRSSGGASDRRCPV